mgnify:CR=1 FL=1
MAHKQNPGWRAGASCDQIAFSSHKPSSRHQRRVQMLTSRFALSPSMARELAKLCFGEAAND